jgi:hypothetical protein
VIRFDRLKSLDRRGLIIAGVVVWLISLGAWAFYAHPTELIDSYAKCAEEGYPVSDTEPPTCSVRGRTFVGPRTSVAPTASSTPVVGAIQPFDILVEGDSGSTYPTRQEVIKTDQDWRRYWREIHAHLPAIPPLLPVDFSSSQVIALSEGQKPTGGYNLKITTITSTTKGTIVDVAESIPTVTCTVTQSPTNRYFVVRTAKLPPPVVFRITTEHRRCN